MALPADPNQWGPEHFRRAAPSARVAARDHLQGGAQSFRQGVGTPSSVMLGYAPRLRSFVLLEERWVGTPSSIMPSFQTRRAGGLCAGACGDAGGSVRGRGGRGGGGGHVFKACLVLACAKCLCLPLRRRAVVVETCAHETCGRVCRKGVCVCAGRMGWWCGGCSFEAGARRTPGPAGDAAMAGAQAPIQAVWPRPAAVCGDQRSTPFSGGMLAKAASEEAAETGQAVG
jgi:hypothetical protein